MALSPRAWRPRTEPSSSGGPSTTAWQGPTCVRPPTPSAHARARWRSTSQVGSCPLPGLSLPTHCFLHNRCPPPLACVMAGRSRLLFLLQFPLELWPLALLCFSVSSVIRLCVRQGDPRSERGGREAVSAICNNAGGDGVAGRGRC